MFFLSAGHICLTLMRKIKSIHQCCTCFPFYYRLAVYFSVFWPITQVTWSLHQSVFSLLPWVYCDISIFPLSLHLCLCFFLSFSSPSIALLSILSALPVTGLFSLNTFTSLRCVFAPQCCLSSFHHLICKSSLFTSPSPFWPPSPSALPASPYSLAFPLRSSWIGVFSSG